MKSQWLISLSSLVIAVAGIVTLTSQAQAGRLKSMPLQTQTAPPSAYPYPSPYPYPYPPPPPPPPPPPAMTTVRCAGTVTIADNGVRQAPVIIWSTNYFGDQYTPETRCQMVSPRLNSAVAANGGTFKGMRFKAGTVNGQFVVCFLGTGQYDCNSGNMLFTLKPENRPRVGQILEELTNFGVSGSSSIVEDSGEGVQVDVSDLDQELRGVAPSYAPQQPSAPQSVPQAVPNNGGGF